MKWYYDVSNNRKPAKFLIARRIPAEFNEEMTTEELWQVHAEATERFLEVWERIKKDDISYSEVPKVKGKNLMDLNLALVNRMLKSCNFCRWNCKVDRTLPDSDPTAKTGTCQLGEMSRVGSFFHHRGEELVYRGTNGSGTIFFTSCNMRCGFCLHPNSYVITDFGPIRLHELYQNVKSDEIMEGRGYIKFPFNLFTFTYDGSRVKIIKIFKHPYSGKLIQINPLYAPRLLVTPNHEMVVYDGETNTIQKVEAKNLSLKHRLIIPRLSNNRKLKQQVLDVFSILKQVAPELRYTAVTDEQIKKMEKAIELRNSGKSYKEISEQLGYHPAYVRNFFSRLRRGYKPTQVRSNNVVVEDGHVRLKTEKRPGIPSALNITEDLAEFLGFYCAEGHVSQYNNRPSSFTVVLSFGHKEEQLVEQAVRVLQTVFKVRPRVVKRRTTVTVEVTKSSLALLLKQLCGSSASEKKVPEFLFQSDKNIITAFINGYVAGDGCITNGYVSINTISKKLAIGIYTLYLMLGHLPSFNTYYPPMTKQIESRTINQSTLYYVKVNAKRMKENSWTEATYVRYQFHENFITVPIHEIKETLYEGFVYNLEIGDDTHAFMANCLAVGNCQNGSISKDKYNGIPVTSDELGQMICLLRMEGCHNINFVGGDPVIHLHTIIRAIHGVTLATCKSISRRILSAKSDLILGYRLDQANAMYEGEFNAPMLWNSNFFMSEETLRILRTVMDVWLPDLKFYHKDCARRLARTPWYFETVTDMIKRIYDWREDFSIRHLIMPNHVDCCTKPILDWIKQEVPDALVNIMDQYHPDSLANPRSPDYNPKLEDISRFPTIFEIKEACDHASELGLNYEEITFEISGS